MRNYIEYFDGLPLWIVVILMAGFGLMQAIGEILEFKGKVVPEFMKIRKKFIRRREEQQTLCRMTELLPSLEKVCGSLDILPSLEKVPETLEKTAALLQSVDNHYSHDNISMRDKWMNGVNENIDEIHRWMQDMSKKIDRNNEDTLAIRIENMRSTIIDFASYVSDGDRPVTKEQFARVFKMYKEYEYIITQNGLTNGEVDIAIRIVKDAYEQHLRNHNFIEDTWDV